MGRKEIPTPGKVAWVNLPGDDVPHPIAVVEDIREQGAPKPVLVVAVGTTTDSQPEPSVRVNAAHDLRRMGLPRPTIFFSTFVRVWDIVYEVPVSGDCPIDVWRQLKGLAEHAAAAHIAGRKKIETLPTDKTATDEVVKRVSGTLPLPFPADDGLCQHGVAIAACAQCSAA